MTRKFLPPVTFKLFSILVIFILEATFALGQKIEIGQDAEEVKDMIEFATKDHHRTDSYGKRASSRWSWDAKYSNGKVVEVYQCYSNQYLADYRRIANFCRRFIMEQGKVAYVLNQFENVSYEDLKELHERTSSDEKIGEYYFSPDFKHYSKIYLHQNGLATREWRKTSVNKLPKNIQALIVQKQALIAKKEIERERIEEQAEEVKSEEEEKEASIKSKTYDLAQYSPEEYNKALDVQKEKIQEYFSNSNRFPSFGELANRKVKFIRFQNSYNAYYKIEDHSREGKNYGNVYVAGSKDIRTIKSFELVEGNDTGKVLFNSSALSYIPTIEVEGVKVMTEAKFENLSVDFTRGITEVKIKNGKVEFLKDIPEGDLQPILVEKLKLERNGNYKVQYELGDIVEKKILNIESEKLANKRTGLKTLGLIMLLGVLLL